MTRDLAEFFLQDWGTKLNNTFKLIEFQVSASYDEMLAQSEDYRSMHDISYTGFTQSDRAVGTGNGTWRTFGTSATLSRETVCINLHHRWLFERNFSLLYGALFLNIKLSQKQVALEFKRLKKIPIHLQ